MGLGRKRSIGRCDGSTSLTLDIVLFLFAESSICIFLSHFLTQFAKLPHFIVMNYFVWSPRQRTVREFSRLVRLIDISGKIAA